MTRAAASDAICLRTGRRDRALLARRCSSATPRWCTRFFRNKVGAEREDLVQQTFLGCIEAHARYKGDASFKTFLLAIARNQLFKHFSKQRLGAFDFELASVHDPNTSPSDLVARREDQRLLAEALRRVPLDSQIVLELAYWEDFDGKELARVLEVPLNTAYSRLRRAKLAVRRRLAELAAEDVTFLRASSYDRTFTKEK